jgi:hypothetical protein
MTMRRRPLHCVEKLAQRRLKLRDALLHGAAPRLSG